MSCILGFDFGTRLIGVAVGNRYTGTARAAGIVNNSAKGPDWARCDALFDEWKPDTLLVGLPLTMDGAEQSTSRAARAFATTLEQRYLRTVHLVDERLSSIAANQRFAEQRSRGQAKRKDAAALDALAACIIVESWLREELPPAPS